MEAKKLAETYKISVIPCPIHAKTTSGRTQEYSARLERQQKKACSIL